MLSCIDISRLVAWVGSSSPTVAVSTPPPSRCFSAKLPQEERLNWRLLQTFLSWSEREDGLVPWVLSQPPGLWRWRGRSLSAALPRYLPSPYMSAVLAALPLLQPHLLRIPSRAVAATMICLSSPPLKDARFCPPTSSNVTSLDLATCGTLTVTWTSWLES